MIDVDVGVRFKCGFASVASARSSVGFGARLDFDRAELCSNSSSSISLNILKTMKIRDSEVTFIDLPSTP